MNMDFTNTNTHRKALNDLQVDHNFNTIIMSTSMYKWNEPNEKKERNTFFFPSTVEQRMIIC